MKLRLIPSTLIVAAATLLAMPSSHAQNIGFRVGIAPPIAPMTSPILPFTGSPVVGFGGFSGIGGFGGFGGFGVAPIVAPPAISTFGPPPPFRTGFPAARPRIPVRPAPPAPHRRTIVIAPGATVYAPGTVIVAPAPNVWIQPAPIAPSPFTGMPRAQVIAQFGHPSVSIVTRSSETLHFPNGVVIVMQDGFVVAR